MNVVIKNQMSFFASHEGSVVNVEVFGVANMAIVSYFPFFLFFFFTHNFLQEC